MKKTLIYIIPAKTHIGMHIKCTGQIKGFSSFFKVKSLFLKTPKKNNLVLKIIFYLQFELRAWLLLLRYKQFYIRYNPKCIFLNYVCCLLSPWKTILFEHNIIYENELALLKQNYANFYHLNFLKILKNFPIKHICVTNEIEQNLISHHISKHLIEVIQNGYLKPVSKEKNNISVIQKALAYTTRFHKTGIFVGYDFPWHNVSEIIQLCLKYKLGLILVGPQKKNYPQKNILVLNKQNYATISEIYKHIDFAFGTFGFNKTNIKQGCPLKTREYICHGIPIITKNYVDSLEKIPKLNHAICNITTNENDLLPFLKQSFQKSEIKNIAQKELDWKHLLQKTHKWYTLS